MCGDVDNRAEINQIRAPTILSAGRADASFDRVEQ
jgi:hypothetical protein